MLLSQLLGATGHPDVLWLAGSSCQPLAPSSHGTILSVSLYLFPFLVRTSAWIGIHLNPYDLILPLLITSAETLFPNKTTV